jgi:hypothetical protein
MDRVDKAIVAGGCLAVAAYAAVYLTIVGVVIWAIVKVVQHFT